MPKRILSQGLIQQDGFVLAQTLNQATILILVRDGCYEPGLTALLRQHLHMGDVFIDVGANVGYFTLLAASCVGPQGQVHSFEPNPFTFHILKRNVALNQFAQVTLNNLALSNRSEMVQLWVGNEEDSTIASIRRTSQSLMGTVDCLSVTLDEYVAGSGIGKIRAIKLDIEGAELLALQGSSRLLHSANRPDLIALEIKESLMAVFGASTSSMVQLLVENDYELNQLIEQTHGSFELVPMKYEGMVDGMLVAISRAYAVDKRERRE